MVGEYRPGYNPKSKKLYISYIEAWKHGDNYEVWSLSPVNGDKANKIMPLLWDICNAFTSDKTSLLNHVFGEDTEVEQPNFQIFYNNKEVATEEEIKDLRELFTKD